ncbi:uncharacterized protein [Linepithema humile]|uniref:uncharacterized protein n=1 Tax=Linepithema humile TaxID=83485 RepID=UPI00351DAAF0
MLKRFWEIEHNIEEPQLSEEEKACKRIFLENVKRNEEGRFVVTLPVKQDKLTNLGESREIAMRRFKALESRLISQPTLYKEYKSFMHEYDSLGHMRELINDQISNPKITSFYLPHHAVRNEASTTTKVRVVFDGSCKTTTGISLNDTLMVGPTLQEDLFAILTKYRTFKIALSADVSKMYRQVLVDPSQTALQRILWRNSDDEPIRTLELLTVTYGTASASFLAIRSLRKLAEEHSEQYPLASKIVLRDFYVDDLVSGADTLQEALQIKSDLMQLLQTGKFELRKWASNEPALRDNQDTPGHREFILANDKNCERRTLGIVWDCSSDSFKFPSIASLPPIEKPTKRSILSRIALIFDPLGLLGPATVFAKIVMQDLWRLKMDWDESIPLDHLIKWQRYEDELQDLQSISIPRRVITINQPVHLEMHGFSDASETAFGACIYLRATSISGEHSAHLLCSRSRVAPLKTLSLPRLELCASVLLAQLVNKISKCLPCTINATYLWTDSTIVLSWLQTCSREWTTFVANRVAEIQQLTPIQYWHHIRSEDNPADPLSRGVMPNTLIILNLWWSGPPWLSRDKNEWPQGLPAINAEELSERKAKATLTTMAASQEFNIFHLYSKLTKLIHVVAYLLRFSRNSRRVNKQNAQEPSKNSSHKIPPVSREEQKQATLCLVKLIQSKHFQDELKSLAKHGVVNKNSPTLRLNPFIDDTGILRVGGRLRASNLPYAAKHPILLPGHHSFSHLIVVHEHERHLHAGAQATLAAVRQNYWLISARNITRQIVRKCVVCFRNSPQPASAIMGNLPSSRVNVLSRPFEKCGVDYAGPLYHKESTRKNTRLIKCYMAIFVCMATKAVHIELAVDLSTEAFLNVLKRFISRRGCPSDVFSDNGLNFVGAARELNELSTLLNDEKAQQQINAYASHHGICWHFIPPRAPHHGGLWEAAVKSAKRHLLKITKDAHLKYEELPTLLIQIEAILNSRPLTPISSDPSDLLFLTPGHFIIGTPLTAYPGESLEEVPINCLSKWQHVQQLRQHFWKRWTREYLHQFQQRNKWQTTDLSLKIGQMVILIEDNTPPLAWSLGRIQETHPGDDGVSRLLSVPLRVSISARLLDCAPPPLLPIEPNELSI